MNTRYGFFAVTLCFGITAILGRAFSGEPPPRRPDLRVTEFRYGNTMDKVENCSFLTPPGRDCVVVTLAVRIRNDGPGNAARASDPSKGFPITVHYGATRAMVVQTNAPAAVQQLPPVDWGIEREVGPLARGKELWLNVYVVLPQQFVTNNNEVWFQARADNCVVTVNDRGFCTVEEHNENNNRSDLHVCRLDADRLTSCRSEPLFKPVPKPKLPQ